MPSYREQVILAVVALVKTALPDATHLRNAAKPEGIGEGGTVVISDGELGEPEVIFSPTTYLYDHRIPVEIAVNRTKTKTAEEVLDTALAAIGQAVEGDRTFGGLCDFVMIEPPVTDELDATGAVTARWAEVGLVASYGVPNPLT